MKKILTICCVVLFIMACNNNKMSIDEEVHKNVKRVGMVVKIKKDKLEEYKKLHADNNPGVRHLLTKYHMRNFSIFLVQLLNLKILNGLNSVIRCRKEYFPGRRDGKQWNVSISITD